jgi:O-methyltransferase involved in polyketide biosynthesis
VRDQQWLDNVPSDRPALIVADGLMGFLTQDELVSLLDRLIDHFPSGEMVFNSYTKFAVWAARHSPGTNSVAQLIKFPGVDDPHDFERWNPRLELVKEILLSREPEIAEFPPVLRLYYRLQARSTSWSRKGTIIPHYRF